MCVCVCVCVPHEALWAPRSLALPELLKKESLESFIMVLMDIPLMWFMDIPPTTPPVMLSMVPIVCMDESSFDLTDMSFMDPTMVLICAMDLSSWIVSWWWSCCCLSFVEDGTLSW